MVMLLTMLAGWMNRQQQEIIEYLKAENAILRDELQKATGNKLCEAEAQLWELLLGSQLQES